MGKAVPKSIKSRVEILLEEYPEKFGWDEFKPVPGEKIRDLNEFKEIMGII